MGHNMGMLHDFDAEHGGENGACNGQGIMSYGSAPNVWSTCSKNDFLALYNSIIGDGSLYWCLDGMYVLVWANSPEMLSPSPPRNLSFFGDLSPKILNFFLLFVPTSSPKFYLR